MLEPSRAEPFDVLVVDDEPDTREMLTQLVHEYGYSAAAAGSGEEALKALTSVRPRLVLLDLMMPGMDGWEFCRRVRDNEALRNVPIAIVSALRADKDLPGRAEDAGYLRKPIDVDKLLAILRERCGVVDDPAGLPTQSDAASSTDPTLASAHEARGDGPRVLIVEDDSDLRETLATIVGGEGYRVFVACDGRAALDALFGGLRPSVILVDLIMPVMDGWQLCAELARSPELGATPVILMSASGGPLEPPRPQNLVRIFRKPFTFLQLLRAIEQSCDEGGEPPH